MLLRMPSGQFTGVRFNANGLVNLTDSDSAFMAGFSRTQVLDFVANNTGWSVWLVT